MARKKVEAGQVTKADAYREAARTLGNNAPIPKVQEFIRTTFSIEMSRQQISQYRAIEKLVEVLRERVA